MAEVMEEVETKEVGDHVLKVYRSKGRGLLDELAAKRGELADCRAMAGLKDDLRPWPHWRSPTCKAARRALGGGGGPGRRAHPRARGERRVAELEAEAARLDAEAAAGDPS